MRFLKNTCIVYSLLACLPAFAQDNGLTLQKKLEALPYDQYQEKVYVHTDQTTYLAGETIWFKIYVVNSQSHQFSSVSKIAYLEILGLDNAPVMQSKIEIKNGMGDGSLFIPATINSGNYRMRSYTHWMKNFSAAFFFVQDITVINTFKKIQKSGNEQPEVYDVAFFPEGGHLVAGLNSEVAVKMTNTNGLGVPFRGAVVNPQMDTVARFHSTVFGMGAFEFTPQASEYKAVVKPESGKWTTVGFPKVESQGVVMQVLDTATSLAIQVQSTGMSEKNFLLLVHNRGIVKISKPLVTTGTGRYRENVSIDQLGDGINAITLFDSNLNPLCERLYFKRPAHGLSLQSTLTSATPSARKKVHVEVSVAGKTGDEMVNLSAAVIKQDSLSKFAAVSIDQYLLLSSDLKGTVESPGYYFSQSSTATARALDLVMLCHGWSRFNWKDVISGEVPAYEFLPEYRGHIVRGTISNRDGSPARGILTYMASPGKSIQVYPAYSKAGGNLTFEMKSFYGPRQVILQTDFEKDSLFTFSIHSPFSDQVTSHRLRSFRLSPALAQPLLERSINMQVNSIYWNTDSTRRKSGDSTAFYGNPDEHYLLDDYTRFPVLEEVLREYVAGIWVRKRDNSFIFLIPDNVNGKLMDGKPLVLLDGIPVFSIDHLMEMDPLRIREIDVVDKRYYLNGTVVNGVASFKTYSADLGGYPLDPKALVLNYEGLQLKKEFYAPKYDSPEQSESRLPDRRQVLLWLPHLAMKGNKVSFDFYTSDVKGQYSITVQGITDSGHALSTKIDFTVE